MSIFKNELLEIRNKLQQQKRTANTASLKFSYEQMIAYADEILVERFGMTAEEVKNFKY